MIALILFGFAIISGALLGLLIAMTMRGGRA